MQQRVLKIGDLMWYRAYPGAAAVVVEVYEVLYCGGSYYGVKEPTRSIHIDMVCPALLSPLSPLEQAAFLSQPRKAPVYDG